MTRVRQGRWLAAMAGAMLGNLGCVSEVLGPTRDAALAGLTDFVTQTTFDLLSQWFEGTDAGQ